MHGVQASSALPADVKTQATTQLGALRTSLTVVALVAVVALLCTGMIPVEPAGAARPG